MPTTNRRDSDSHDRPTHCERALGALMGLAVGDALGAPLEGLSAQQIRSQYGLVADYVDGARAWKRKPYRWRLPGLYSDDTQQALALADCLLSRGRIDPDWLAECYLAMATPRGSYVGSHRGVGKSFREVLDALERGVSPRESGRDSAGIGAAMRIAPLGIAFAGRPDGLFEAVLDASLITHRDCRSLAGALAVAHAVRRLVEGEDRTAGFLLRLAGDVARDERRLALDYGQRVTSLRDHYHSLSAALAHAETILDRPREQALAALVDEANRHGADPVCRKATMGFPPACIPTCLYLFLTTESFEEAVVEVVNLGGDADTTGAILGALAGAFYGVESIPDRLRDGLQNREGVELRASALAAGTAEGLSIPDLIETERLLSEREAARRETLLTQQHPHGGDLGANRRM